MTETEFEKYTNDAVAGTTGFTVEGLKLVLYPWYDMNARTTSLACAYVARVVDGANTHVVVTAVKVTDAGPDFSVWCGDKFLEVSGLSAADADQRCTEALTSASASAALKSTLLDNHGKLPAANPACNFWVEWRRKKALCEHTNFFLAHLRDNFPDFRAQLVQGYDEKIAAHPAGPPPGDMMALNELAFRVPVLFEGDRGAGKTVTARAFARDNGYPKVEMGGHEGVESLDMLGYSIPAPSGEMVWKDGPLSEAFRRAKTEKTVLIIDELMRIRMRELSILLTAFSPDLGVYRLRTGRIVEVVDGIAREEELECPVANLCVVATTNVGSEYAVDETDPALAERFVPIRMDTSEAELKRILGLCAKAKGFKAAIVPKCVTFYKKMVEARARGLVARTPTTRTLCRAVELAKTESDVIRALKTQILLWVARTSEGQPVPEQVQIVEELLTKLFPK